MLRIRRGQRSTKPAVSRRMKPARRWSRPGGVRASRGRFESAACRRSAVARRCHGGGDARGARVGAVALLDSTITISGREGRMDRRRRRSAARPRFAPPARDQGTPTFRRCHAVSRAADTVRHRRWPASTWPMRWTVSPRLGEDAARLGLVGPTMTTMPMPQLKVRAISSSPMRRRGQPGEHRRQVHARRHRPWHGSLQADARECSRSIRRR